MQQDHSLCEASKANENELHQGEGTKAQVEYGKETKSLINSHNNSLDSVGVSVDCLFLKEEEGGIYTIFECLGVLL